MKRWKSRNSIWPVQEGTTEEIVEAFLDIHHWWFTTKTNSLFRHRPNVKKMLIDYIEQDVEPGPRDRYGYHYVITKFCTEYFRDFKQQLETQEETT
jgi:hypothetical protein